MRVSLREELKNNLLVVVGLLVAAAAYRMYLIPNRVVNGGFTGVGQLLNQATGLSVGFVNIALNVPLFLVSMKSMGLRFGVRSLAATVLFSLMLDVLHIGAQYNLVSIPLSLALAFFMTHIFEYRRLGNWPIIPALILLGFATVFFLMLTPGVNAVLQPYYGTILPLVLIIVGICVLVRGGKRSKKSTEEAVFADFAHKEEDIPAPETWAQPPVEPVAEPVAEEPVTVMPEPEPEPVAEAEPAPAEVEPIEVAAAEELPVQEPAELPEEEKKSEPTAE